ncbi:MAG: hypothetical protein Q9157_007893 [Trypethelium eluteriae]
MSRLRSQHKYLASNGETSLQYKRSREYTGFVATPYRGIDSTHPLTTSRTTAQAVFTPIHVPFHNHTSYINDTAASRNGTEFLVSHTNSPSRNNSSRANDLATTRNSIQKIPSKLYSPSEFFKLDTGGRCWQYDYNDDLISLSEDGGEDTDSPALRRRFSHVKGFEMSKQALRKRRGGYEVVSELGNLTKCKLTTLAPRRRPARITLPPAPSANELERWKGASWWYVPTTTSSFPGQCPSVVVTKFRNAAALTKVPVIKDVASSEPPQYYKLGGSRKPIVNVDHVYETKFLRHFLSEMIDSGQMSCSELNAFFMASDPLNKGAARLQTLWDQLQSESHPEFAGMDEVLNSLKGIALGSGRYGVREQDDTKLQFLNMLAAAVDVTNRPDVAKLFRKTNQRVYEAFLGIDELVAHDRSCGKSPPTPRDGQGWANAYSSYMSSILESRNAAVSQTISKMANNVDSYFSETTDNMGKLNSIGRGKK